MFHRLLYGPLPGEGAAAGRAYVVVPVLPIFECGRETAPGGAQGGAWADGGATVPGHADSRACRRSHLPKIVTGEPLPHLLVLPVEALIGLFFVQRVRLSKRVLNLLGRAQIFRMQVFSPDPCDDRFHLAEQQTVDGVQSVESLFLSCKLCERGQPGATQSVAPSSTLVYPARRTFRRQDSASGFNRSSRIAAKTATAASLTHVQSRPGRLRGPHRPGSHDGAKRSPSVRLGGGGEPRERGDGEPSARCGC